jgi:hypothetical protein
MGAAFQTGDLVIYRKSKYAPHVGRRAIDVEPAAKGEFYRYSVEKCWVVEEVRSPDEIVVRTRSGRHHVLNAGDRNLRRARWWERLLFRGRFPRLPSAV